MRQFRFGFGFADRDVQSVIETMAPHLWPDSVDGVYAFNCISPAIRVRFVCLLLVLLLLLLCCLALLVGGGLR